MYIRVEKTGLDQLRLRLIGMTADMIPAVAVAMVQIGNTVADTLSQQAPKGAGDSPPPAGDAGGPLSESFVSDVRESGIGVRLTVRTTQPTKLMYVRKGHGEVLPVAKKALYWKGLTHPVKHAKRVKANDFVKPVLKDAKLLAQAELSHAVGEILRLKKS